MILKQHLMKFWFCEFCQKEFLRMIHTSVVGMSYMKMQFHVGYCYWVMKLFPVH